MLPEPLRRVVQMFARLPGVGEKTAQRFALQLMSDESLASELSRELAALVQNVRPCERCGNIAEVKAAAPVVCNICADERRDPTQLCVVARVPDLVAIERSGAFRGRYHVLHGLLATLDGIHPENLPIAELRERVEREGVRELVVATPLTVEGEATALYLADVFGDSGVEVTRIASGMPHGGELEFTDQVTLGRALAGRKKV